MIFDSSAHETFEEMNGVNDKLAGQIENCLANVTEKVMINGQIPLQIFTGGSMKAHSESHAQFISHIHNEKDISHYRSKLCGWLLQQ